MLKLFQKLPLSKLKSMIKMKNLIPNYQAEFRGLHWTREQVRRIVETIERILEEKD